MSSLRAPWQNDPYKNQYTELQKHAEHQDATDIWKKKNFKKLCLSEFSFFFFFYIFKNDLKTYIY